MRWRRRRTAAVESTPGLAVVPVPKMERALVALAVHAQQLDDRLDRLERRLDASVEASIDAPTHDDVLEVRLHSAKVAAELARVTVELRAEMEQRITHLEARHTPTARERRIQQTAETILDLSDRLDTMPSDFRDAASA